MKDKNGLEINLGDKVKDIHGRTGEYVFVNGATAIKFEHDGKINYAFSRSIIEAQIEKL